MGNGSILVSASWLQSIQSALGTVTSSGQASAAIDEATSFADQVSSEVGGIFAGMFSDPWRSAAMKQVSDASDAVRAMRIKYSDDSDSPVGNEWSAAKQKVADLYALAQVIRQGYPDDVDGSDLDSILIGGLTNLSVAISTAPSAVRKVASGMVGEATGLIGDAVDDVGGVLGKAVKVVGDTASGLTKAAADAVNNAVPWELIIGGIVVVGLAVYGIVYMNRHGVKVNVPL
jgi:hypothetical protein